jgi:hypothetical protein
MCLWVCHLVAQVVYEFRPLPKRLTDNEEYVFRSEQLVTRCEDVSDTIRMLSTANKWKGSVW